MAFTADNGDGLDEIASAINSDPETGSIVNAVVSGTNIVLIGAVDLDVELSVMASHLICDLADFGC